MTPPPTTLDVEAARKLATALLEFAMAVQAGGRARSPQPAPPPASAPKQSPTEKKSLMSALEAAAYLSISPGTLFNHSAPRGPIPVVRMGARVLYAVEDLEVAIKRYEVRRPE